MVRACIPSKIAFPPSMPRSFQLRSKWVTVPRQRHAKARSCMLPGHVGLEPLIPVVMKLRCVRVLWVVLPCRGLACESGFRLMRAHHFSCPTPQTRNRRGDHAAPVVSPTGRASVVSQHVSQEGTAVCADLVVPQVHMCDRLVVLPAGRCPGRTLVDNE